MYAKIIVDIPSTVLNEEFDYFIPKQYESVVNVGSRVLVKFGYNEVMGYVVGIVDKTDYKGDIREILEVLDLDASLTSEQIELANKMSYDLNVSTSLCLNLMLPAFLKGKYRRFIKVINVDQIDEKLIELFNSKSKVLLTNEILKELPLIKEEIKKGNLAFEYEIKQYKGAKKIKYYSLSSSNNSFKETNFKKTECLNYLKGHKEAMLEEICDFANCSAAFVHNLEKEGYIQSFTKEIILTKKVEIEINYDYIQKQLKTKWERNDKKPVLLFSNDNNYRLNFCLDICQEKIKKGKRVMFVLPTILACEEMNVFLKSRLKGYNIVSFNSSIAKKDFYEGYMNLKNDFVDIVVTTRVGIFFPINSLGLIIMINEEENNYINEFAPNFDTKDVLEFRANYNGSKLLYVSSTPLIETYHRSIMGKYSLLEYQKEFTHKYSIIDMKNEVLSNNKIFSRKLLEKLEECLFEKKQALLVLNSKGYSSLLTCRNCGKVYKCPKCDIPLVLYKEKGYAQCSFCNLKEYNYEKCQHCGSETLNILGYGLEQAKEKLVQIFPEAKILQVDSDNLKANEDINKALLSIEEQKVDFIIGTNVLTKMLKNDNIYVVGILNIDNFLNMNDYNSSFLVYSLIANCAIRYSGFLFVQTYYVENNIIKNACAANYDAFFAEELKLRKMLLYPPFVELNRVYIRGEYKKMYMFANSFKKHFSLIVEGDKDCLGPVYVYKFRSVQLLLKHNDPKGVNILYKQMVQKSIELKIDLAFEKNPKMFR